MANQNKRLEALLKRRWLTQLQAYDALECTRLAARVKDLRDSGITVHDRWVETESGKRIKAYRILPERRIADVLADDFIERATR
ncbi:MAG: helix-turn-helix domain-containing protein [Halieaceae bacterium]